VNRRTVRLVVRVDNEIAGALRKFHGREAAAFPGKSVTLATAIIKSRRHLVHKKHYHTDLD
jgi:hypothetical protein